MRYEHILQIYWTKGFFFSGNLFYFDKSLADLFFYLPGLGTKFYNLLVSRFELTVLRANKSIHLIDYQNTTNKTMINTINIILSQVNSVNNRVTELKRLNIIRLYLIKSYRGRSHALGKPVRAQRTWSNGWNSYNVNSVLRRFISETSSQLRSQSRVEKINYKVVKKKYATKASSKSKNKVTKKTLWF